MTMVIILIRRFVKPNRETEFLAAYSAQKPVSNIAFKGETLTKINSEEDLPPGLSSLHLNAPECITYLNVAQWASWDAFAEQFDVTSSTVFDPTFETQPRQRVTLNVVASSIAN